jgi:hypothetical protein
MSLENCRVRSLAVVLVAFALAACGSSGDSGRGSGGLIDQTPGGNSAVRVPALTLLGPTTGGSPGVDLPGFFVRVTQGNSSLAAENVGVSLTATNGTVSIVERGEVFAGRRTGFTDAFGRLSFVFTPDPSLTERSTGTVTATITDPRYIDFCLDDEEAVCEDRLAISIQLDDFRFTAPAFEAAITIGAENAEPLEFTWRDANGQAVVNPNGGRPCVDLKTRFSGGTAPAGIIVGGDPTPRAQRLRVPLDSSGDFAQTVEVVGELTGTVEIDALENRRCETNPAGALIATTTVQFIDEFCEQTADGRDCVDLRLPLALTVVPSATEQPSVELVMEVRNKAFQPIRDANVDFKILSPAVRRPNERVFPGGGRTDANGLARSRYYAPNITTESLVDIEACLRGASSGDETGQVCRRRQLTLRPSPTSAP